MERGAWTEERLDDLAASVRAGFARNDEEHREMRAEMRQGFAELRTEIRQGFAELRTANHRTNLALIVGLIGVLATLLGGVLAAVLSGGV